MKEIRYCPFCESHIKVIWESLFNTNKDAPDEYLIKFYCYDCGENYFLRIVKTEDVKIKGE